MVKSHEIDLSTSVFNKLQDSDYIILENNKEVSFETNDYILFRQTEVVEEKTSYTGLHQMIQIKDVIKDSGLKEGYVLLLLRKL